MKRKNRDCPLSYVNYFICGAYAISAAVDDKCIL